jgi:hypothetical protein
MILNGDSRSRLISELENECETIILEGNRYNMLLYKDKKEVTSIDMDLIKICDFIDLDITYYVFQCTKKEYNEKLYMNTTKSLHLITDIFFEKDEWETTVAFKPRKNEIVI